MSILDRWGEFRRCDWRRCKRFAEYEVGNIIVESKDARCPNIRIYDSICLCEKHTKKFKKKVGGKRI